MDYCTHRRKSSDGPQRIIRTLVAAGAVLATGGLGLDARADYAFTVLASFNGNNGTSPYAGVVADPSGNLYGTTWSSNSGYGTVFKLDGATHAISTLVAFNGVNGENPASTLIRDLAGNLYGTTKAGGTAGAGTVFRVDGGTNVLTTLANFNVANGAYPFAGVIADPAGNLYGTTAAGGANGQGTVFRVAAGTNVLTTLASFNNANGREPHAALIRDAAGNLYGTTQYGGANDKGTVFRVDAITNAVSTLASFSTTSKPLGSLVADPAGNLYGTTSDLFTGGFGTVFKVAAGTNTLTTLANFNSTNGANPVAGLVIDAEGNLLGTTNLGGAINGGTVFQIDGDTLALTTPVHFINSNGLYPLASLSAGADGKLFGTTQSGGAFGYGVVFQLTPIPEPSSLAVLALGAIAVLARRRRMV